MSTTPTGTPATSAEPQSCCGNCSNPRTKAEFMRNHVETYISTQPDDRCGICWDDYSSIEPASGSHHVGSQVINLPGCSHVFGYSCIRKLLEGKPSAHCPFCREPWYIKALFNPNYTARQLAPQRDARVAEMAEKMHMSLEATYIQFRPLDPSTGATEDRRESEGKDRVGHMTYTQNRQDIERYYRIEEAVRRNKEVRDLITHLQDTEPCPIDARLYNPYANVQEPFDGGNIWRFRNWHKPPRKLTDIASCALATPNGQRLQQWYAKAVYDNILRKRLKEFALGIEDQIEFVMLRLQQDVYDPFIFRQMQAETRELGIKSDEQILKDLEDEFVAWYGEEDVRVFSRFLIKVVAVWYEKNMLPGEAWKY